MTTYRITAQDEKVVGILRADGEDYVLTTTDADVRVAVEDVLSRPAIHVWGDYRDGVVTQNAEEIAVGDPGHLDAAMTNGSLVHYGLTGRREGNG